MLEARCACVCAWFGGDSGLRVRVGAKSFEDGSARTDEAAGCLGTREGAGVAGQIFRRVLGFELKSLILAQIERWRHALHMQVERQRGGNPGGERRTGE